MESKTLVDLFKEARTAHEAGRLDQAKKLYEQIVKEFPDTVYGGKASEYLKNLEKYGEQNSRHANPIMNHGNEKEGDYSTTRGISKFVSFVGWLIFIAGLVSLAISIASLFTQYKGFSIMTILPALGAILTGLLVVMGGQITRATVDNANFNRQTLQILTEMNQAFLKERKG